MANRVAIIGAGPVGLTLSLLLKKFKIPITLIERKSTLSSHPSAHYINLRSMEIFSELYNIDKKIYSASEPIEDFQRFMYVRRLFEKDNLYGFTDQFAPSVKEKERQMSQVSYSFPAHLPQHTLAGILNKELLDHLEPTDKLLVNTEFVGFEGKENLGQKVVVRDRASKEVSLEECKFMIACDGFRSTVRDSLKIGLAGNTSKIWIDCISKRLAKLLLDKRENAMLHFIYNYRVVAVLVNHSYERGEFVMQVPISPDFQELGSFTEERCFEIINSCIDSSYHLTRTDAKILNIGFWNLSGVIADKYFHDNVVLCGDAAHSFPPAGGFGMNTGIQDAYNLAYKLAYMMKHNLSEEEYTQILKKYSDERRSHAQFNLSTAMRYYGNSLRIANYLGLKKQNLELFEGALGALNNFLPSGAQSKLFELGKMIGSSHLEIAKPRGCQQVIGTDENHKIPLLFLKEETQWRYQTRDYADDQSGLAGLLCPHFYIEDSKGAQISLRQLPSYMYNKAKKDQGECEENLYVVVRFKDSIDKAVQENIEEAIEREVIKGKQIHVQIANQARKEGDNIFSCRGQLSDLLNKLGCNESNVLVIRADATLIAKL